MDRSPEMGGGGEGREELGGKFVGGVGVGVGVVEGRYGELVEVDGGGVVRAVEAELGLAEVGGGADVVDGDGG